MTLRSISTTALSLSDSGKHCFTKDACFIRMVSRVEEMFCTCGDENIEGDEVEDDDDDISSGSMRKRKKIFALRKNFRKLRFSFSMKPKLCFCFIRGGSVDVKTFAFRRRFNAVATKLLPT